MGFCDRPVGRNVLILLMVACFFALAAIIYIYEDSSCTVKPSSNPLSPVFYYSDFCGEAELPATPCRGKLILRSRKTCLRQEKHSLLLIDDPTTIIEMGYRAIVYQEEKSAIVITKPEEQSSEMENVKPFKFEIWPDANVRLKKNSKLFVNQRGFLAERRLVIGSSGYDLSDHYNNTGPRVIELDGTVKIDFQSINRSSELRVKGNRMFFEDGATITIKENANLWQTHEFLNMGEGSSTEIGSHIDAHLDEWAGAFRLDKGASLNISLLSSDGNRKLSGDKENYKLSLTAGIRVKPGGSLKILVNTSDDIDRGDVTIPYLIVDGDATIVLPSCDTNVRTNGYNPGPSKKWGDLEMVGTSKLTIKGRGRVDFLEPNVKFGTVKMTDGELEVGEGTWVNLGSSTLTINKGGKLIFDRDIDCVPSYVCWKIPGNATSCGLGDGMTADLYTGNFTVKENETVIIRAGETVQNITCTAWQSLSE